MLTKATLGRDKWAIAHLSCAKNTLTHAHPRFPILPHALTRADERT